MAGGARMGAVEAVVQWVRTSWTKQSRGGPAAARRNAVPDAFRLPPPPPSPAPSPGCVLLGILMDEADDFRPMFRAPEELSGGDPEAPVLLGVRDGLLRVLPVATPFGMPRRWRRPPAVRLARGSWLRWQINYRFAGTHHDLWTYRLDTFNVAHGPGADDLFLGPPAHDVRELAALR